MGASVGTGRLPKAQPFFNDQAAAAQASTTTGASSRQWRIDMVTSAKLRRALYWRHAQPAKWMCCSHQAWRATKQRSCIASAAKAACMRVGPARRSAISLASADQAAPG